MTVEKRLVRKLAFLAQRYPLQVATHEYYAYPNQTQQVDANPIMYYTADGEYIDLASIM